jgi:SagB-type dehydrogenase family enzyme
MTKELEQVLHYHQSTKHHHGRFARGPAGLDWATQPDPFRRYRGAPLRALERPVPAGGPSYESSFRSGALPPATLDLHGISQLFFDSLALSAWKRSGDVSWALRVNPSSGNLHPTEGYLICGPVAGLTGTPMVAHYAPRDHALEVRAEFPLATWQTLSAGLPQRSILVGLASIHWREAWKYGERAFRYCQHDVGHAIAAISMAAAGLGWQARLLDGLATEQLAGLLGISGAQGAEAEHPDCLLVLYSQDQAGPEELGLPAGPLADLAHLLWLGRPNQLSQGHAEWPIIDEVAKATAKPPTDGRYGQPLSHDLTVPEGPQTPPAPPLSLRQIIHRRRSAVAIDPHGTLGLDAFYRILHRALARPDWFPFNTLPWDALVHLVLFVHRVDGLLPGLYLVARAAPQESALRAAFNPDFAWQRPATCPEDLPLYRLVSGDAQAVAQQLSCYQEIAAHGCFSLGMIAEFERPLQQYGPWFYRRLFWECGMVGQVLYLEAEAAGVRGTGIGCFFDDAVHQLLGLDTIAYQSLYHFTVGHPIEDPRLTTLPAY